MERENCPVVGVKIISPKELRQNVRSIRSMASRSESSSLYLTRRPSHGLPGQQPNDLPQGEQHSQKDAHHYMAFEKSWSPLKRFNLKSPQYSPLYTFDSVDRNARQGSISAEDRLKDNPWDGKVVLSLDGRATKGFQSIMVLRQLMEAIKSHEGVTGEPKPCHYFDYIVGTGTGGLIAILLGRLRMSVDECSKACEQLMDTSSSYSKAQADSQLKKNPSSRFQETIDKVVKDYGPASLHREQEDIFASHPIQCKTIVVSFDQKSGNPCMLGTYDLSDEEEASNSTGSSKEHASKMTTSPAIRSSMRGPQEQIDHPSLLRIGDVASATVDSHKGFPRPISSTSSIVDGGWGSNNPSFIIYSELSGLRSGAVGAKEKTSSGQDIHSSSEPSINTFVSIGISEKWTSKTEVRKDATKSILRYKKYSHHKLLFLIEHDVLTSHTADTIMRSLVDSGRISDYFRLIGGTSSPPSSSTYSRKGEIEEQNAGTDSFLNESLQKCAANLVAAKRIREKTNRWPPFAGPFTCSPEQQLAENFLSSPSLPEILQLDWRATHIFFWRVPEFWKKLEGPHLENRFDDVVTINRISNDKYWICTCLEFIKRCWPAVGPKILELITRICVGLANDKIFQEADFSCGGFIINITATAKLLRVEPVELKKGDSSSSGASITFHELIDCYRWLICALMPDDGKEGLFRTNMICVEPIRTYLMVFKAFKPTNDQFYCWTKMFPYACIIDMAFGEEKTPKLVDDLKQEASDEPEGLKIKFELMLECSGIERMVEEKGVQVLYGLDTALVPSTPKYDRWHLLRIPKERSKLSEIIQAHVSTQWTKFDELEKLYDSVIFVGWAAESRVLLGTSLRAAPQNLLGSRVETVRKVKEKSLDAKSVTISAGIHGTSVTGGLQRTYAYGGTVRPNDKAAAFENSLAGPKSRRVIIYDGESTNATLLPEIALLVFATFASLKKEEYAFFKRPDDDSPWTAIENLALPSASYDITKTCEEFILDNAETEVSKDSAGSRPIQLKDIVFNMSEKIVDGHSVCRKNVSKERRSDKKALWGFDLREAVCNEDIYLRRLKCSDSMKAWGAAARETDVVFVHGLGALVVPACNDPDCLSTYPGLLNATVQTFKKEYSRNTWDDGQNHMRIGNTESHWIIQGRPCGGCRNRDSSADMTCKDISRIQFLSKNSNYKALFHKWSLYRNARAMIEKNKWSEKIWSNQPDDFTWEPHGIIRFGKVKPSTNPIPLKLHDQTQPISTALLVPATTSSATTIAQSHHNNVETSGNTSTRATTQTDTNSSFPSTSSASTATESAEKSGPPINLNELESSLGTSSRPTTPIITSSLLPSAGSTSIDMTAELTSGAKTNLDKLESSRGMLGGPIPTISNKRSLPSAGSTSIDVTTELTSGAKPNLDKLESSRGTLDGPIPTISDKSSLPSTSSLPSAPPAESLATTRTQSIPNNNESSIDISDGPTNTIDDKSSFTPICSPPSAPTADLIEISKTRNFGPN